MPYAQFAPPAVHNFLKEQAAVSLMEHVLIGALIAIVCVLLLMALNQAGR